MNNIKIITLDEKRINRNEKNRASYLRRKIAKKAIIEEQNKIKIDEELIILN